MMGTNSRVLEAWGKGTLNKTKNKIIKASHSWMLPTIAQSQGATLACSIKADGPKKSTRNS
jgi:hypothetical protein